MKYNVYDRKTQNLLVSFVFFDKKVKDTFLLNFRKLKNQVDIVEVAD